MLNDLFVDILRFANQGGDVIWVLLPVSIVLWLLIIERYWFIYLVYPRMYNQALDVWLARDDDSSWYAHKIREAMISQNEQLLAARLSTIKTLIAICPMLGLLGTVTGMVGVFDTIAIMGNSDAKAMAAGIYRATLPTMSGLVLALSALYFNHHLQQKKSQLIDALSSQLLTHKEAA